jgi:hypothetical protein
MNRYKFYIHGSSYSDDFDHILYDYNSSAMRIITEDMVEKYKGFRDDKVLLHKLLDRSQWEYNLTDAIACELFPYMDNNTYSEHYKDITRSAIVQSIKNSHRLCSVNSPKIFGAPVFITYCFKNETVISFEYVDISKDEKFIETKQMSSDDFIRPYRELAEESNLHLLLRDNVLFYEKCDVDIDETGLHTGLLLAGCLLYGKDILVNAINKLAPERVVARSFIEIPNLKKIIDELNKHITDSNVDRIANAIITGTLFVNRNDRDISKIMKYC